MAIHHRADNLTFLTITLATIVVTAILNPGFIKHVALPYMGIIFLNSAILVGGYLLVGMGIWLFFKCIF